MDNPEQSSERLISVDLDEHTVVRRSPQIEHERKVAIYDLLDENSFVTVNEEISGPYKLHLSIVDNRILFDVRNTADETLMTFTLPGSSFRRIIKDYFMICESYFAAIKTQAPSQIEAIDMGRRGLHDEGAELLSERLEADVVIDKTTARRLFTLICVLHIRG